MSPFSEGEGAVYGYLHFSIGEGEKENTRVNPDIPAPSQKAAELYI